MVDEISLKEYFEKIMFEKDKAIDIALSAAKEAVMIAEANAEKWRSNANEWRAAMTDREKKFVPVEALISIERELGEFRKFREERGSVPSDIIALQADTREVRDFMKTQSGKADQSSLTKTTIVATVGVIAGVLGIVSGLISLFAK